MTGPRVAGGAGSSAPALPVQPAISEDQWSHWVYDLARRYGWVCAHFRPAETAGRWITPVGYDAAGFPDMVMVHPQRRLVLFRELKVGRNTLDARQRMWRDWLTQADADYDTWHPRDRATITEILTEGAGVLQ